MIRIFISHSHSDEIIAKKLVDYLFAALTVEDADIRCTSVVGHKLPPGTNIESQLKKDINGDIALIGLLTQNGLRSQWVLFELGAAWGSGKLVIPILGPLANKDDLPGPLKSYIPVSIEDKEVAFALNDMIHELASNLNEIGEKLGNRNSAERIRNEFIDKFKAWKSQLPATDESQQKEIEKLKAQIQDLERAHDKKLQEMKATSQKDKEDKERNYQNQKQELEQKIQSLQSQIKQLEQQLDQERSHSKQLQEMEVASQKEKEELEQNIRLYKSQIKQLEQQLAQERLQVEQLQLSERSHKQQLEKLEEVKREKGQAQNFTENLGKGKRDHAL